MFAVISLRQLEQMLDQGQELLLVDLRPGYAYEESHLYGAVNIPYGCLDEDILQMYGKLPVVFYCEHGGKSMQAAREFGRLGWRAARIGSGICYYHGKYLVSG